MVSWARTTGQPPGPRRTLICLCFQSMAGEWGAFSPPTHEQVHRIAVHSATLEKKETLMTKDLVLRLCPRWRCPCQSVLSTLCSHLERLKEQDSGSSNLFGGLADSQLQRRVRVGVHIPRPDQRHRHTQRQRAQERGSTTQSGTWKVRELEQ